eukprot:398033-Amphidinium_carterae.1
MADRLGWKPTEHGLKQGEQNFSWEEAARKVKSLDSSGTLRRTFVMVLPDFQGLEEGLATPAFRRAKNPPDDEAVAAAKQHDQVTDLRRKLLDTGA